MTIELISILSILWQCGLDILYYIVLCIIIYYRHKFFIFYFLIDVTVNTKNNIHLYTYVFRWTIIIRYARIVQWQGLIGLGGHRDISWWANVRLCRCRCLRIWPKKGGIVNHSLAILYDVYLFYNPSEHFFHQKSYFDFQGWHFYWNNLEKSVQYTAITVSFF